MADARLDEKAGVWCKIGHVQRVLALDRLAVIAVEDSNWSPPANRGRMIVGRENEGEFHVHRDQGDVGCGKCRGAAHHARRGASDDRVSARIWRGLPMNDYRHSFNASPYAYRTAD